MKHVTDFHKTVEASVDLCLILVPVMQPRPQGAFPRLPVMLQSIPSVPNGWDIQNSMVGLEK